MQHYDIHMKPQQRLFIIYIAAALLHSVVQAASFDSGSTGAAGDFKPDQSITLNMPEDGVFHFGEVVIPRNVEVTFNLNGLRTPVYFLAKSNVLIDGVINVSGGNALAPASGRGPVLPGRGGPGGFDGGYGKVFGRAASSGQGPGAGTIGGGKGAVFASPTARNTNIYGNSLLVPMIGGSGGCGEPDGGPESSGGGGGGGAILIASSTRITIGDPSSPRIVNVVADGGNGAGGGSGGGIRLVAPIVGGVGSLRAGRGISLADDQSHGTGGRIRIDSSDRSSFRSLGIGGGELSIGSQMYVVPSNSPSLRILQAAGQTIASNVGNEVNIALPPGASTNQVLTVRATGFTQNVPITIDVVPESGRSHRLLGEIPIPSGITGVKDFEIYIPPDSFCNIKVWTR